MNAGNVFFFKQVLMLYMYYIKWSLSIALDTAPTLFLVTNIKNSPNNKLKLVLKWGKFKMVQ